MVIPTDMQRIGGHLVYCFMYCWLDRFVIPFVLLVVLLVVLLLALLGCCLDRSVLLALQLVLLVGQVCTSCAAA